MKCQKNNIMGNFLIVLSIVLYLIYFIWSIKLVRYTKRAKITFIDVFMTVLFCWIILPLLIWNEERNDPFRV